MYYTNNTRRRRNQATGFCKCERPPTKCLLVAASICIMFVYLSALINRTMCDSEKSTILSQCDSQMEQELVKLRRCTEEKSSLNSKLNDLQWEVEKLKRSNKELETQNSKLNQDIIESNSKLESFEKENEQLKVNNQDLKNLKNLNDLNEQTSDNNNDIENGNKSDNSDNSDQSPNNEQLLKAPQNTVSGLDGIDTNNEKIDHSDKLNDAPMIIDDHKSNPLVKDENENENENPYARNQVSLQSAPVGIAVLILCYNRPDYLHRTLESVLRYAWFACLFVFNSVHNM